MSRDVELQPWDSGSVPVEVASGIDGLYLSGRTNVPQATLTRLADARTAVETGAEPCDFEFGGQVFAVAPHGFGKYRYRMTHPYGVVGVSPSEHLPPIRVQPRAEFLHGVGAKTAVAWFRGVLEAECGGVFLTASRIDLHADWQGWVPGWEDRDRFVCRADALAMRGDRGELTGWEFGRRDTNTLCARIYDKTLEIEHKGNDYWLDIWGHRYRPELPVIRVEFEIGRTGMREFGINTPEEAIDGAGGMWMGATHDWLTYRTPTNDQTRSRWPIAEEWRCVQRATIAKGAQGLERMREGQRLGQLRTLAPGLVGYLASFAALSGTTGVLDTCRAVPSLLRHYEQWSGIDFSDRIATKRRKWAV